jgi:hypothetical protein
MIRPGTITTGSRRQVFTTRGSDDLRCAELTPELRPIRVDRVVPRTERVTITPRQSRRSAYADQYSAPTGSTTTLETPSIAEATRRSRCASASDAHRRSRRATQPARENAREHGSGAASPLGRGSAQCSRRQATGSDRSRPWMRGARRGCCARANVDHRDRCARASSADDRRDVRRPGLVPANRCKRTIALCQDGRAEGPRSPVVPSRSAAWRGSH